MAKFQLPDMFTIKDPSLRRHKYFRRAIIPILLIGLFIAADLISKYYTQINFKFFERREVIPGFFYLTYITNDGMAFGLLSGARTFFLIITPFALIAFVFLFLTSLKSTFFHRFSLAMVIGGTIGNYVDRLFSHHPDSLGHLFNDKGVDICNGGVGVRDMLTLELGGWAPFGVFNIADMCLVFGVIMLAVFYIFLYKEPGKNVKVKIKTHGSIPQEETVEEYLAHKNSEAAINSDVDNA